VWRVFAAQGAFAASVDDQVRRGVQRQPAASSQDAIGGTKGGGTVLRSSREEKVGSEREKISQNLKGGVPLPQKEILKGQRRVSGELRK